MHTRPQILAHRRQQGFVLIVALVLLLVLTVLGLAAAQSTSLEERMAGNARNQDMAFQAAEAALRAGQKCVQLALAACSSFSTATTNGNGAYLFSPTSTTVIWAQPSFWTTANNTLYYNNVATPNLPQVAAQPQFIIEQLPAVAAPGMNLGQAQFGGGAPAIQRWRITTLGTGGDQSSTVMLQEVIQCCG